MLSCKEVTELATTYVEGKLPFWRRLQLRMHVAMCRHCRALLDQMRKTVLILRRIPRAPVDPGMRADLVRRFREVSVKANE